MNGKRVKTQTEVLVDVKMDGLVLGNQKERAGEQGGGKKIQGKLEAEGLERKKEKQKYSR